MSGHNAQSTRQRFFIWIAITMFFGVAAVLSACSGSSSTTPATTPPAGTDFTAVFTEGVAEITPQINTSAVTDWDGWCANDIGELGIHRYSLLNKLFNPDSGVESVYGPLESVENVLGILESNSDLVTNGTYQVDGGDGTYTAVVSDFSGDFTVPYFGHTQSGLTQKVVITAGDGSFSAMIAYDMDGDDKALVAHTKMVTTEGEDAGTSYELFRANYNETSEVLQIWVAHTDNKTDSFKIQFVWKGNMSDGTFALTQSTNAAKGEGGSDGFWLIMGGGNMEEQMAFRAETNDNPGADYFVMVTMDDITSATAPAGYPADSGVGGANIDSTTYPVQSYIDTAHANCLGWLSGFPEASDLLWDY